MILLAFCLIFLSISVLWEGVLVIRSHFVKTFLHILLCQSNGGDPACHFFQEEYNKYPQN